MIKSILRQIRTLERHSSCLKIIVLQCVLMEHKLKGLLLIKDWSLMNQEEFFEKKYKEYLWQSYNAYSHVDSEILIEVTPEFVEIWDEDEDRKAFQLFIDFKKKTVEYKPYD